MLESGAQNPNSYISQEKAKDMYEQIKRRKKDYINVAKNTGFSIEQCKIIKDYIFINSHELRRGFRPFDPDFAIASSWFRLSEQSGNHIQKHDTIMLYHELCEILLLLHNSGMSQSEAHKRAESEYNYTKACKEYYRI